MTPKEEKRDETDWSLPVFIAIAFAVGIVSTVGIWTILKLISLIYLCLFCLLTLAAIVIVLLKLKSKYVGILLIVSSLLLAIGLLVFNAYQGIVPWIYHGTRGDVSTINHVVSLHTSEVYLIRKIGEIPLCVGGWVLVFLIYPLATKVID